MDAIALLCTLHANGPVSLRRLRRAGFDSLEAIAAAGALELAEALGGPPSLARRFAREAQLLARRTGAAPLEEADGARDEVAARAARPAPEREDAGGRPLPPVELRELELLPHRHGLESPTVVEVEEPRAVAPVAERGLEGLASATPPASRPILERLPDAPSPAPREEPSARPELPDGGVLRPGLLPRLDERACRALVEQGVRTLDELVRAAGLGLARRVGLSYTRLLDLQYEAGLLLRRGAAPEVEPAPAPELAAAAPPKEGTVPARAPGAGRLRVDAPSWALAGGRAPEPSTRARLAEVLLNPAAPQLRAPTHSVAVLPSERPRVERSAPQPEPAGAPDVARAPRPAPEPVLAGPAGAGFVPADAAAASARRCADLGTPPPEWLEPAVPSSAERAPDDEGAAGPFA